MTDCLICGINNQTQYRFGLRRCLGCGFIFSPEIEREGVNAEMGDEYFGESFVNDQSAWVKIFEFMNNKRSYKRLYPHVMEGGKVLEIGVGSGSLLNYLTERGYDVTGLDLSPAVARVANEKYGATVFCESIFDHEKESVYDAVIMNHVLEHVQAPIEFLSEVKKHLKRDGCILIAVPNIRCFESALPGWNSYEPYHLSYFDSDSLQSVIEKSGLSIIYSGSHESFSGWFLAALRTILGFNKGDVTTVSQIDRPEVARGKRKGIVDFIYRCVSLVFGYSITPFRWMQSRLGRGDELFFLVRNDQGF